MSSDNTTQPIPDLHALARQVDELHAQIKELSDMHKHYYAAAEYYFALAQDPPENPRDSLSIFSAYLQDCMFAVMEKAESLLQDLKGFSA